MFPPLALLAPAATAAAPRPAAAGPLLLSSQELRRIVTDLIG